MKKSKKIKKLKKQVKKLKKKVKALRVKKKKAGVIELRMYEYYNNRVKGHINSGWTIDGYIKYSGKMIQAVKMTGIIGIIKCLRVKSGAMSTNPLLLYERLRILSERMNLKFKDGGYYLITPKKGPEKMP